jgi:hypothetical protein
MINQRDRQIIRDLAKRIADIADMPEMEKKREMWKRHNRLERVKPMILVFPEGSWDEIDTFIPRQCTEAPACWIEFDLLRQLWAYENIRDDKPVEKIWTVEKKLHESSWGIEGKQVSATTSRGAYRIEPVIKEASDLKKLRFPEYTYDEAATMSEFEMMQDLIGDIMDVQIKGVRHVSFHLMGIYTVWRGVGQVMEDMYDEPEMLHDAMAFLAEAAQRRIKQYIDQNLLSLNNDKSYQNSGGVGYSTELPKPGFNPDRVRPCDMWASAEAQEMAQVSPKMHREFVLKYEKKLLEGWGLLGYGCCEDLTNKLDDICSIPNMRRISIAPSANVDKCAEKLQENFIFSWKPQPSHLVGRFDEKMIENYIRHALEVSKNCVIELILKDTHTCENHPERFTIWTDIAQRLATEYAS